MQRSRCAGYALLCGEATMKSPFMFWPASSQSRLLHLLTISHRVFALLHLHSISLITCTSHTIRSMHRIHSRFLALGVQHAPSDLHGQQYTSLVQASPCRLFSGVCNPAMMEGLCTLNAVCGSSKLRRSAGRGRHHWGCECRCCRRVDPGFAAAGHGGCIRLAE